MTLSADDYVEKITGHLGLAEEALAEATKIANTRGGIVGDNCGQYDARSLRSEAWSSVAQEHNSIAQTYTKLLEITTKAGMT